MLKNCDDVYGGFTFYSKRLNEFMSLQVERPNLHKTGAYCLESGILTGNLVTLVRPLLKAIGIESNRHNVRLETYDE